MPYFITDKAEGCSGWATIKDDGEVIGCHTTKQDAIDQMVAVSIAEDMEPGGERAVNQDAPAYMRAAARRGLEYYADGKGGDGLVEKTIREARLMASGQVSDDKWVRTAAWIARHLGDLDSPDADPNSDNYPSAGVVAHLLWGSGPSKSKAMAAMEYAQSVAERVKNDELRHLPGKHDQKTHASGGKSSSPEAIAQAEKLQAKAIAAEPAITQKMQSLSENAGGELIGLEYKIKGIDSMSEKIDTKAKEEFGGDVKLAAADIGDSVRYTMALSEGKYAAGTKETIDNLAAEGYTLKVKNYWQEGNIYKGVNVTAVAPNGQKFELQFHTKSSFELKEVKNHKLYEEHRKPRTSKSRKSVLEREMAANWDSVKNPTDLSALKLIGSPVLQPAS
jgi:hypothetical protein